MKTLRRRMIDTLKRECRAVTKLIRGFPKASAGLPGDAREALSAQLQRELVILSRGLKRLSQEGSIYLRDFRFGPTTFWNGVSLRTLKVDPNLLNDLNDWWQGAEDEYEPLL